MYAVERDLLKERISLFSKATIKQTVPIPCWTKRAYRYEEPIHYTPLGEATEIRTGESWRCGFTEMHTFEAEVTVPQEMAGERLVLELSFGGEGLVYLNGERMSAVTHYEKNPGGRLDHRERVDVTEHAVPGTTYEIRAEVNINYKDLYKSGAYRHYTDELSVEYKFRFARLISVDDASEGYLFDVQTLLKEIDFLSDPASAVLHSMVADRISAPFDHDLALHSRDDALVQRLTDALRASLRMLPAYGTAEELREAVPAARERLWQDIGAIKAGKEGQIVASGFAHMDMVWLWQEKHSVRKIINTFCNALALIERYPEYVFTFSQPYTYQLLEQHAPEVFEKVRQRIREGRIDPIGNLFVEMDANLASGEAIVRQLLYGRAYYLEKFGKASDVFFMPDSFGYPASMPQIIKRAGVNWFFTSKLTTNQTWRFPYTFFYWQGIDGTRIGSYLLRVGYNGRVTPERVENAYRRMEDKALCDTAFLTYGHGDGGGGADYRMVETTRRIDKLPGIPHMRHGMFSDFFREAFDSAQNVPVWDDELYLDRHRGTYTTRGDIKKKNRRAELLLRDLEIFSSIREVQLGIPYPKEEIHALWHMILPLQFHDSLPGSSIPQVFRDADSVYVRFFSEAEALLSGVLKDLAAASGAPEGETVYFSSLPFASVWQDPKRAYAPVALQPFGASFGTRETDEAVSATDRSMENRYFRVEIDENGLITGLFDKRLQKQMFRKPGNVLQLFDEISGLQLSAWDLYAESLAECVELREADSVTLIEHNDRRAVIRVVRTFGSSRIEQDICVYSDVCRVDVVTRVDWHETMKMLKAAFYPAVHTREASYEIQFGAVKRPTHRNTAYDALRFEACAHRWADLSQADCGVSILNDCKYGYDAADDTLRISLLRAPLEPDESADRGMNEFTYSIYPHTGGFELGGTVGAGLELNLKPYSVTAQSRAANEPIPPLVSLQQPIRDGVILDTIKKAEDGDGFIFRFYEAVGASGSIRVNLAASVASVAECDLMEQDCEGAVTNDANGFAFSIKPFEIRTFRVRFMKGE